MCVTKQGLLLTQVGKFANCAPKYKHGEKYALLIISLLHLMEFMKFTILPGGNHAKSIPVILVNKYA